MESTNISLINTVNAFALLMISAALKFISGLKKRILKSEKKLKRGYYLPITNTRLIFNIITVRDC